MTAPPRAAFRAGDATIPAAKIELATAAPPATASSRQALARARRPAYGGTAQPREIPAVRYGQNGVASDLAPGSGA